MKIYQKIIILFIISLFFLPAISLAQPKVPEFKVPATLDEAKILFIESFKVMEKRIGGAVTDVWQNEVLPVWQKMWEVTNNFWRSYLGPRLKSLEDFIVPKIEAIRQKILQLLGKEVEKRTPIIEEEFQKEKEEMKEEIQKEIEGRIPKVTPKTIWDRLWDLLK